MDPNKLPKPIMRVAKPIRLDQSGNPITYEQKENIEKIQERDPSFLIFIVTILIIIACFTYFVCYVILPRMKGGPIYKYNDVTKSINEEYFFKHIVIDNTEILENNNYKINEDFIIKFINNYGKKDIYINNEKIATSDEVLNDFATIDDLLILVTQNKIAYSTTLYAVDKLGNIVYKLYNINNIEGLRIRTNSYSIKINSDSINLLGSRLSSKGFYVDNNTIIDYCDREEQIRRDISDDYVVNGYYYLKYLGNHKFSNLERKNPLSLGEYINDRKLCK